MLRSTNRWGWVMLVLVAFLTLAGAAPAAADDLGSRSSSWSWLTRLFDLAGWTIDPEGDTASNGGGFLGGLVGLWANEGAGLDPYGNPVAAGKTVEEGAGLDPYGTSLR